MELIHTDSTTNRLDSKIFNLNIKSHREIYSLVATEKQHALASQQLGTVENDVLTARLSKATRYGLEGNDLMVETSTERNVLVGNAGSDRITGSNQDDVLHGGADRDILTGRGGNDHLVGGADGDNDGWHTQMFYLPNRDITAVIVQNGDDVSQRRNNGNPAFPKLLIDDLIEQMVQRVET
jgi:Ca2+-binding RTX toxin-like protein